MATRQLTLPMEIVKKSNALCRARWSADSVLEPRLVALLASKVRADDIDLHVYEIPASEILKGVGGKDYKELETVIDKVMSRVLTIRDDKGWSKYNVFFRCRYRKHDGILELGIHPDLKPHYLALQRNFAKWNLLEYLMLPSVYSQRIFEFLKSWDDKPETIISLIDLHEMLDTPESFRANFKDFRRRVLEKAQNDIHKHTTLRFEWEPVKKGRAVEAIRFIFGVKRSLPVAKKKADDAAGKAGERQRELAAIWGPCLKARGPACEGGHQKPTICKLCHEIR